MSNPIKKIVIEVGGTEIGFSPEDALVLRDALIELFPVRESGSKEYVPMPYPVSWPRPHDYWQITNTALVGWYADAEVKMIGQLSTSNVLSRVQ